MNTTEKKPSSDTSTQYHAATQYSKEFILSLRGDNNDPPKGFHPVYIKQKRIPHSRSRNTGHNSTNNNTQGSKWCNLEKIRAFTSSENSFTQRTRNLTASEILIGEVRELLNKVTVKTFNSIMLKLTKLDYKAFDEDMAKQTVKVYLTKSIASIPGVTSPLFIDIGELFMTKFTDFEKNVQLECDNIFKEIVGSNVGVSDIQKCKCIGLMRMLPYFIKSGLVSVDYAKINIIDVITENIQNRKETSESYASIASTGGCGLYIELLCRLCEQLPNSNVEYTKVDCFKGLEDVLVELKTVKTIPARVRFMVEDTLEEINKP